MTVENSALTPYDQPTAPARRDFAAGMLMLAQLPEEEFETRLAQLEKGQARLAMLHKRLMVEGVDYGVLPGTNKPSIYKPGSEKLAQFYNLVPEFIHRFEYGDGITAPPVAVIVTCRLRLGSQDGPIVGEGGGACSSWESKYRYRRGERTCPKCGMAKTIIKGKAQYGGGWLCWKNKGGCDAKFSDDAPEIVGQVVGDVENPDPYELLNTILKMAQKRAHADATLRTTGTSGIYTQDVEDLPAHYLNQQAPAGDEPSAAASQPAANDGHRPGRGSARAAQAARGGETQQSYSGATTATGNCPECHAPAGKHGSKCSRRGGQDLQMQQPAASAEPKRRTPPPGDRNPEQERLAQNGRMHAAYAKATAAAGIDPENDGLMRDYLGAILTQALGSEMVVRTRAAMTLDELRICADYLESDGLPDLGGDDASSTYERAYEDPFDDQ